MIYASLSAEISFYPVLTAPREIFATLYEPPVIPATEFGQLFDEATGALLFDELTGAPLTV